VRRSRRQGGLPGYGVYNELIITNVSWIGENGQRRKLDESKASVIASAGRTLERRKSRLCLEAFDEVFTSTLIVRLIDYL